MTVSEISNSKRGLYSTILMMLRKSLSWNLQVFSKYLLSYYVPGPVPDVDTRGIILE